MVVSGGRPVAQAFVRTLVLCMAAVGFVRLSHAQESSAGGGAATERPDIVFILSDDQAWNDYSFMGHEHIKTPNIDQLARESLVFTRGYVPDSLCRPSLATIISGLYPHQHGIVGNDPPLPQGLKGKPRPQLLKSDSYLSSLDEYLQRHIDHVDTLPDRLKPLGYRSFQTGKWWEGKPARGGFDEAMTHGDPQRGGRHGDEGLKIGRQGMEPIRQFVREQRTAGQPYFLWYAPMMPHTPHDPPDRWLEQYSKVAPTPAIAKYWAMCAWFDETIGQLRRIIAEDGRPQNTIIVYVTDNGWINLPDKSAYAPKSKRSQYDGGVRTPIMVHWPKKVMPRREEEHLASSVDLVPTTLALLGLPHDSRLPGINLCDEKAVASRRAIYGEIFEHDIVDMQDPVPSLQYRWVIRGWDKLIVPYPRTDELAAAPVELYDLKQDPSETVNLAARTEARDKVASLRAEMDAWWQIPATVTDSTND